MASILDTVRRKSMKGSVGLPAVKMASPMPKIPGLPPVGAIGAVGTPQGLPMIPAGLMKKKPQPGQSSLLKALGSKQVGV